jgi:hypothetical protein
VNATISQHCPQCDRDGRVVDVMGCVDAVLGTCGHVVPLEGPAMSRGVDALGAPWPDRPAREPRDW